MSKSSERFSTEWEKYKKEHNNISVESIIDQLKPQKQYYRERFSKFKNGSVKLNNEDLTIFSELFNIRQEYLAGIDDYRTNEDFWVARQREKGLFSGIHQILVALGYADTHMEEDDYNPTFPQNTYAFLESLKDSLDENNVSLICDVNADTYISIPTSYYEQMMTDIIDYMAFKLDRLFTNASPIPTVIMEDDSTLLHPSTTIRLKDGSSITVNIQYTPNSEYDTSSFQRAFSITEHSPNEE